MVSLALSNGSLSSLESCGNVIEKTDSTWSYLTLTIKTIGKTLEIAAESIKITSTVKQLSKIASGTGFLTFGDMLSTIKSMINSVLDAIQAIRDRDIIGAVLSSVKVICNSTDLTENIFSVGILIATFTKTTAFKVVEPVAPYLSIVSESLMLLINGAEQFFLYQLRGRVSVIDQNTEAEEISRLFKDITGNMKHLESLTNDSIARKFKKIADSEVLNTDKALQVIQKASVLINRKLIVGKINMVLSVISIVAVVLTILPIPPVVPAALFLFVLVAKIGVLIYERYFLDENLISDAENENTHQLPLDVDDMPDTVDTHS